MRKLLFSLGVGLLALTGLTARAQLSTNQSGDGENEFAGKKEGSYVVFDESNPLDVKFALYYGKEGLYSNYHMLSWGMPATYYTTDDQGLYYYVMPATIDPETKDVTINAIDFRKNQIRFDYTDASKKV